MQWMGGTLKKKLVQVVGTKKAMNLGKLEIELTIIIWYDILII
jgi:hypothetical protein